MLKLPLFSDARKYDKRRLTNNQDTRSHHSRSTVHAGISGGSSQPRVGWGRVVVEVARSLEMSDKMLSNWVRRGRREELLSHNGPTHRGDERGGGAVPITDGKRIVETGQGDLKKDGLLRGQAAIRYRCIQREPL
ncbi:MAG: hypothetical protein R3B95_10020 [Nitrospirales bacterium]|nr:hypothetical protein [Nitrospirales bacterium]